MSRRRKKRDPTLPVDHRAQYQRHSVVPIEEVLPLILSNLGQRDDVKAPFNGVMAKVTSLRLRTFALKGCECAICGLKATHFALETTRGSQLPIYHLNLWAQVGDGEILFTHDHVLARALGGRDHLDNTQTTCGPCNWLKSVEEGAEYRRRRDTTGEHHE